MDGVEGLGEELLRLAVELGNGGLEVGDGLVDVLLLGVQEVVALLELVVFLERVHVDGAQLVDLLAQLIESEPGLLQVDLEPAQLRDDGVESGVVGIQMLSLRCSIFMRSSVRFTSLADSRFWTASMSCRAWALFLQGMKGAAFFLVRLLLCRQDLPPALERCNVALDLGLCR